MQEEFSFHSISSNFKIAGKYVSCERYGEGHINDTFRLTVNDDGKEIRKAFIAEYFTPHGRLAVDTMTAYVVVLYMGLTPDYAYENVCEGF